MVENLTSKRRVEDQRTKILTIVVQGMYREIVKELLSFR